MFISMFKKTKHRGVAMVEYAVLLSFICIAAGLYLNSDNGIDSGIDQHVNKVVTLLDGNKDLTKMPVNLLKDDINIYIGKCTNSHGGDMSVALSQATFRPNDDGLYILDPDSAYELVIDTSKAAGIGFTGQGSYGFTMQLLSNNNDGTHYSLLDSSYNTLAPAEGESALSIYNNGFKYYDSPTNAYIVSDGSRIYATSSEGVITYKINTGDKSISLGGNIVHNDLSPIPESQKQNVIDFIKQGFSLTKVG